MSYQPLISVVTIVLNDLEGLRKTFNSVIKQTYSNVEYIVIDGGSNDGSAEFIKDNASSFSFSLSEKDKGIADAFNKGIAQAKGKWILFLNAGDTLISASILQEVAPALILSHDLSIVYGKINLVDDQNKTLKTFGRAFDLKTFKREMNIPHQATFHNAKLFDELGLYDLKYKYCMDYEFLLRIKKPDFKFVNMVISNMAEGGVSQQDPKEVYKEFNKVKKKHLKSSNFKLNMDLYENMLRYRLSKLKQRFL